MTVTLKKILHIDDDAVMRMMVKKSLERSGKEFEIISCSTVKEFTDAIPNFMPDVFLIDVIMPEMKGPDLLLKVRNESIKTPAIFMTGKDDLEIENRDILEPIIGIIPKPFSTTTLGEDLINLWFAYSA